MATTVDRPESWAVLTPNQDVFVAALAHIEEFPEHHDQGPWRCGSSMCFGGWATQVVGFRWKTKTARSTEVVVPLSVVPKPDPDWPTDEIIRSTASGGQLVTIDCMHAAMIALGIDGERAGLGGGWIFDSTNTLPRLYELSAKILSISERTLKRKVKKYRAEHKFRDFVKKPKTLSKPLRWRKRKTDN